MMKVKIAETAEKHGVKSAYALQKALNISPTIAARLWKGEFDKIGINTLEKLCEHFQCQTNEFLEYPLTQKSNALKSNDTQKGNTKLSKTGNAPAVVPKLRKVADGMLLFSDVCIRLNKSESSVRRYLTDKRLKGEKVKREWQILESDVEEFERSEFFQGLK
jgi:DNA-binding Xre family transcriptional regulator